jgi:predicted DNA-binding transcriptional regulator AlpA
VPTLAPNRDDARSTMLLPMTRQPEEPQQAESTGPRALLADVVGVAKMLDRSPTSIRRDDKAGNIPRPVSVGGAKKWRIAEILAWVEAGCPKRRHWELMNKPTRLLKAG